MLTSARVATRNLWGRPGRTLLSLGAIAFGVAGIIVAGGFVQDVFVQLGEATIHSQLGHVQIGRNGYFSRGAGRPGDFLIDAPGPLVEHLAGRDEVDDVLTRISFSGLLNNGRSDFSVLGEGVEPDKEARLGSYVMTTSGRALAAADRLGIALGHGVAEALRLKPGDAVTLVASTPDGAINTQEFNVVGTFRSYSREFDARAVRIQLAAAQSLLAVSGVNTIIVSLKDTSQTDAIAALAQQRSGTALEVKTWYALSDFYEKTRALYERQFLVFELIILVLVLLAIRNTMNLAINERIGEFGTIRVLGYRGREVVRMMLIESAMLGLLGSATGVAIGIGAALLLSAIGIPMPPPPNADIGYTALIRLTPATVLTAALIGGVSPVIASFAPALRAARMPLAMALRHNA